jgi:exopolyphosphatase/guanosine-5'-triphosphate,3'-diphosphate pyrophosphatase
LVERQAVIDIGSNTVRLVVFGGPPRAPVVLHNERVTARLGKDLAEKGVLSQSSMKTALAALRRFVVLLSAQGNCRVITVATAATRDAGNGARFLQQVADLGLNPRQISGEEEARLSASGVIGAFPGAQGVVADLGGGSLELVRIKNGSCKRAVTMPLGTLRLPALLEGGQSKFSKRVSKTIADSGWQVKADEPIYLVGGTFRAIARYMMFQAGSPFDDPHGFEASPRDTLLACRRLCRSATPPAVPGVSLSRLAGVAAAAALLAALIRSTKSSRIIFSAWGLREGLLVDGFTAKVRQLDPLTEGVDAFVESMGVDCQLVDRVLDWIAPLTADAGTNPLLRASVALSLAARKIEPNLRACTVLDWALHKRWIGIDGPQRAMLAACLVAASNRALPAAVAEIAPVVKLAEAIGWGLAVRLCIRLTSLAPELVEASALVPAEGKLSLRLTERAAPLATEPVLRDLKQLADHFELVIATAES